MYNLNSLIPIRFLSLIAHFGVDINLLWVKPMNVMGCLPQELTLELLKFHQQTWILIISLLLLFCELLIFLFGLTMFNSTSNLLSVLCHFSAIVLTTSYFVRSWLCGLLWLPFLFCSTIPIFMDLILVCNFIKEKTF